MNYSVELQPPFQYMILWLILGFVLIGLAIFLVIFFHKKLKNDIEEAKIMKIKKPKRITLQFIKGKYMKELSYLDEDVRSGKITPREGYQRLSLDIRLFVYEVTGIRVQECTLMDIERLNIPALTQLVREYYRPEFAPEEVKQVSGAIMKTRGVIDKWN